MGTIKVLDVTVIEPRLKHPTIFECFDELESGEEFVIHNDHDPKPLYYQLLGERGDVFSWEYLNEGPEFWRVKIRKRESGETSPTVGQLVAQDYRKAEVFKKFGIDFCCGGKKTLEKACQEKGINISELQNELKQTETESVTASQKYSEWDPGFLSDYIVNTHHKYVEKALPVIYEYTQKVARVHGYAHPETIEIANIFEQVIEELNHHMMKEEEILFPYIKWLEQAYSNGSGLESSKFQTVMQPIGVMEQEHEEVGMLLEKIKELSSNFIPPASACTTYRLAYAKLKEFEEDLHQHIHLENNILFPAAFQLEQQLAKMK